MTESEYLRLLCQAADALHAERQAIERERAEIACRLSAIDIREAEIEPRWWTERRPDLCPIGRGNSDGYGNHGCRCEACREANAAAQRNYMRRHPEQRRKQGDRYRTRMRRIDPEPPQEHTET